MFINGRMLCFTILVGLEWAAQQGCMKRILLTTTITGVLFKCMKRLLPSTFQ